MRIRIELSICVILITLLACSKSSKAQIHVSEEVPDWDTLQVISHNDKWAISHMVQDDQNLFMLSRLYHVPPAILADMNSISFQTPINPGAVLYIPFAAYNQAKTVKRKRSDVRPLYYIVRKYDNLYSLAHLAGREQKQLQQWNGMTDNYIEEGQRLFVGWVLYDNSPATHKIKNTQIDVSDTSENASPTKDNRVREVRTNDKGETVVVYRKITPYDTLPEIHKKFLAQTDYEKVITEEKGAAVFYENKGKLSASDMYFAFHNTAKPGTIIKVHNPGTDKTIFVKVLGTIPDTKLYHNCIIGISDGAKKELLVTEDKAWCELTFAPPQ